MARLSLAVVFALVVLINCVNGIPVILSWVYNNAEFSLTLNTCQQLIVTFTATHTFTQVANAGLLNSCDYTDGTTLAESGTAIQFNASQIIYALCATPGHCLNGNMHIIITVNNTIEPGWVVKDGVCVMSTPTPTPTTTTAPTTNPGATISWFYGNTVTALTVNTCESLTFQYTTGHNVYNLTSLANFNNCSFAGATEIATTGPLTLQSPITGTFYLACGVPNHCTGGNMKVAVTVSNTVAPGWSVINGECVASSGSPTPTGTPTPTPSGSTGSPTTGGPTATPTGFAIVTKPVSFMAMATGFVAALLAFAIY